MFEKGTRTAGEQWGTTQTYGGMQQSQNFKSISWKQVLLRWSSGWSSTSQQAPKRALSVSRAKQQSRAPRWTSSMPWPTHPTSGARKAALLHASLLRAFLSSVAIQPATWYRISAPGSYGMVLLLRGSSTWQRVGGQHPSEMEARPQHPPKEVSRSWLFTNKAHWWEHRDDCSQDLNYRLYTFP